MTEAPAPDPSVPPSGDAAIRARAVRVSTRDFVDRRIHPIQEQYVQPNQTPWSRAALAQLRRGVGQPIGSLPDLLPLLVNPDSPPPRTDEPTPDEIAIYTALTLYGVHQQSQHTRMHDRSRSFGAALGTLRYSGGAENPGVVRRFQAMCTAPDLAELAEHARSLITLLRASGHGFHYGRFAEDLVRFQDPRHEDEVRLRWGRDFYRVTNPPSPTGTTTEEKS
ncbi:type I-E CRISPR-associated protein Cse2/CasB [Cellulomonas hominis]